MARSAKELLRRGPLTKGVGDSSKFVMHFGDGPSDEEVKAYAKRDPEKIEKIWVDGIGRDLYYHGSNGKSYFFPLGLEERSMITLNGYEYRLQRSEQYPNFIEIVGLTHGEMPCVLDAHATLETTARTL